MCFKCVSIKKACACLRACVRACVRVCVWMSLAFGATVTCACYVYVFYVSVIVLRHIVRYSIIVSLIVLRHIVRYSIIVSFSGSLGDAVASSLVWQNQQGQKRPKLQALVYDILPWRKVPESDARSVVSTLSSGKPKEPLGAICPLWWRCSPSGLSQIKT